MIASLRGTLLHVDEKKIILDVRGIGFAVAMSSRDLVNLPGEGEEAFLYTHMSVREDEVALYGFLDEEELRIFRLLITVSGIGPKAALGILSGMSGDELSMAVLAEDAKTIAKAPGIGPKTARKLILELKDKIDPKQLLSRMQEGKGAAGENPAFEANKEEAVQVLTALGFSRSEAVRSVRSAELTEDMNADQIITAALRERN